MLRRPAFPVDLVQMTQNGPAPRTYRLDAAAFDVGFDHLRGTRLKWLTPVFVVLVLVLLAVIAPRGPLNDNVTRGFAGFLLVCTVWFLLAQGLGRRRGRRLWASYELSLSDDVVRLSSAARRSPLEIRRADVTQVVESPGRGLTVLTAEKSRTVFVPAQLVGYDEARALLVTWGPSVQA
jgi:hypothetical protein